MAIGSVTQKLRPVRLALLVDPSRPRDLLKAIQLSSTFWGGALNPIVPCFKARVPSSWARDGLLIPRAKDIANGYIEGFDPDILVAITPGLESRHFGSREALTPEALMGDMLRTGSPDVGVGAIELVHRLSGQEFKYVRQDSAKLVLPTFERAYALFLSSVFGAWPKDVATAIKTYFGRHLPIDQPRCGINDFEKLLAPELLFARRIGTQDIEYEPRDPCIYFLDATSPLDVLDFWNLRAAGHHVVPVPLQAEDSESLRTFLRRFIETNYSEDDRFFRTTTVQVGRSVYEKTATSFVSKLGIAPPAKGKHPRYVVRTWYPRLWDRWARENANEHPISFYAGDTESSLSGPATKVDLKTLTIDFPHWGHWSGQPRYVNEVSYSTYGADMPLAEVLPEGSGQLAAQFGLSAIRQSRLSRTGPTYLLGPFDKRIFFEIPQAESFMLAWLREQGWKAEISSPGLIATQMLKRLRGRDGIFTIHSESLIKLLDKHSSERREQDAPDAPRAQKWIKEKTLRVEVGRIIKDEGLHFDSDHYIKRLLEARVIGLGLELHCPTCLRWMWKSIEHLSAEVECDQCLSAFPIALAPQEKRECSYKLTSPFNVRGYGNGAYPVLFTWKFFTGSDRKRTTPILSFNAKKGDITCEVDLALFCDDGSWRSSSHKLILAECKAYDALKSHDIQRMERLGAEFPGAILVFSKFSLTLSSDEKKLLTALVGRQRRMRLSGKPYALIMILTGTELFAKWGAPECWKNMGDPHKKWLHAHNLEELAEATLSIYLDVPPLHQWAANRPRRSAMTAKRLKTAP